MQLWRMRASALGSPSWRIKLMANPNDEEWTWPFDRDGEPCDPEAAGRPGGVEQAERIAELESKLATLRLIARAAARLLSEVRGNLGAFELEVRETISNTNYNILAERAGKLQAALDALSAEDRAELLRGGDNG
jgi:hypothetical protein